MKNTFLRPLALVTALSLGTISSAHAAQYTTIDSEASSLVFAYSQMNVNMNGSFSEIKATDMSFDPADPESAKVSIEVALSSIDAGSSDTNVELAKKDWLASEQYPIATFTSDSIDVIADGSYEVTGELSIKGNTQTVTIPFNMTESNDTAIFTGNFTFQRGDFNIGEGSWSSFGVVANDVEITFEIVAKQ